MHITNRQMKAARALLGWEQVDLAERSGVAIGTIRRMEGAKQKSGDKGAEDEPILIRGNHETVVKVVGALEAAGIQFIPENGGGEGVRFRARRAERQAESVTSV